MYNEKIMDHFSNPRNVGEVENPSGVGEVGNMKCGDIMKIYIKVNQEGVIEDIKFKTFGCGAAIASSSVLTEMVKGKTLEEAEKITNQHASVIFVLAKNTKFYIFGDRNFKPLQ